MKIIGEIIKNIVTTSIQYAGRLFEVLLILSIVLVFFFRSQWFQTFVAQQLASYYSTELDTIVSVDKVKIVGLSYIELENFYIEDQKGDTLLFAPKASSSLKDLNFKDKYAVLKDITCSNTRIKLQQYKGDDQMNIQFLLDYFDQPKSDEVFTVKIEKVGLDHTYFSYHNWNKSRVAYGLDYNHIELRDFKGDILEFRNRDKISSVDLKDVAFNESSGFTLKDLDGHFVLNPKKIKIEGFHLKTDRSEIITNGIAFNYQDLDDLNDFINAVFIEGTIKESNISIKDISYFVPSLKDIESAVDFSGEVNGTINNLFVNELNFKISDKSYFKGNVEFKGLTDFENCLIYMDIEKCQTSKLDLESIDLTQFGLAEDLILPKQLEPLGIIELSGIIDGFYNDFGFDFKVQTEKGNVNGNFSCQLDTNNQFYYKGGLSTFNFDAGSVLGNSDMGEFSSDLTIDGEGLTLEDMDISIDGQFKQLTYMNYVYDDIVIHGNLQEKAFNGKLDLFDEHIDLIFEGDFDLSQSPVMFDFNINVQKAHLYDLNIIDERESSSICFDFKAAGFGNNLDDFSGMIELKNISYYEKGKDYYMDSILFDSQSNPFMHSIELYSKFAECRMTGHYNLDSISNDMYLLGSKIVPSIFPLNNNSSFSHDDFVLDINVNDLSKLTELLIPELSVSPNTHLTCNFDSDNDMLKLFASSEWIEYNNMRFANIQLDTSSKVMDVDTSYVFDLKIDSLFLNPDMFIQNLSLKTNAYANNFDFLVEWHADDSSYLGTLRSEGLVLDQNHFKFNLLSSDIYSKKAGSWKVNDSIQIELDSSAINVTNFSIANDYQLFSLNGAISEDPNDQLFMNIQNVELSDFNGFFTPYDLNFSGLVNLKGSISDVYNDVHFDSKSSIDDLILNNNLLGDINLFSKWDPFGKRIIIDGNLLNENNGSSILIRRSYYNVGKQKDYLDFKFIFKDFDLTFANAFLDEDIMSELKGEVKGKVSVKGELGTPRLAGKLQLSDGSIKMEMFNTTYFTNGRINIKPDMISVDGIPIKDKYGSEGLFIASFYHQNFSKYNYDLLASFSEPFMVMNTTYKMNPYYYGKAFVTGDVMVEYDTIKELRINIEAQSEKGTDVTLPLYGAEEVVLQDFITFNSSTNQLDEYEVDLEGINMELSLDLTEDAHINLVFDEVVGDAMEGTGNGHIDMVIDKFYDFYMYGEYKIAEANYLFTLKDFLNKNFLVKRGGTINWYGDPYKADIDLVTYYPLKTSLFDIMPDAEKEDWKQKTDVNVEMHLTDNIFNPEIDFDIILPRANQSAKSVVKNLVSSDQEMNKQVFSLLILNQFMTNKQDISDAGVDLSISTTTEMLSSQLSNMISKFSDDFDLGFKYSPGDEISNDEVTIAMSTQQFNDRLTIETNLGVSQGNKLNQNPSSFIGDVDVEYKLNSDGNLRVHAFNESNEYDFTNLEQSQYTQGVGAFYKQSFNNWGELFCEMGNLFKRNSKECKSCENKAGRETCRKQ